MTAPTNQRPHIRTVGILGAGRVGAAVAKQALKAGYDVRVATAQPPADIALLVGIMAPGAVAVTAREAAESDLVVVAVPLHKYRTLQPEMLSGRVVVDVMNYWAPIDGELDDFKDTDKTSSEIVQAHLAGSKLVKTLNHIGYHELIEDGQPAGALNRRALALAGDDQEAKGIAAEFIDRLGYDPVDAGPLKASRFFQPGTEIFNGSHTAGQLTSLLDSERAPVHG